MIVCQRTRAMVLSLVLRSLGFSGLLLFSAPPSLGHAQITLDGSLGPRGALTGPHYTIADHMGQIRGSNLFHSFGQFNLSGGKAPPLRGRTRLAIS
jgi:hypothetical protein